LVERSVILARAIVADWLASSSTLASDVGFLGYSRNAWSLAMSVPERNAELRRSRIGNGRLFP
jgi:hypothetical protein